MDFKRLLVKEKLEGPRGLFYIWAAVWILGKFYDQVTREVGKRIGKILDIGTGPGILTCQIARQNPEAKLTGIDLSSLMIEKAKVNGKGIRNLEFLIMDGREMSFPDNYFDFILSTFSFHHFRDKSAVLVAAYRVLKPGGEFWIYECLSDFKVEEAKKMFKRFLGLPPLWFLRLVFIIHGYSEREYYQKISPILKDSPFAGFEFYREKISMKIVLKK